MSRTFSPCGSICSSDTCRPCPENSRDNVLPWLMVGGGRQTISKDDLDRVLSLDKDDALNNPAPIGVKETVIGFPDAETPSLTVIEKCSIEVDDALLSGERLLIRCHSGLNRAPFIAAYWMITRGYGNSSSVIADIIALRSRAGDYPLSNVSFKAFLETL